jgi:c-di-GMP-binding flagellar brake protein YcgR
VCPDRLETDIAIFVPWTEMRGSYGESVRREQAFRVYWRTANDKQETDSVMISEERDGFFKVGMGDVEIGRPLRHSLYDGNRELLLRRGYVIETARQCELLVERGLYRSHNERPEPPAREVVEDAPPASGNLSTLEMTQIRIGDTMTLDGVDNVPRLDVKLIGYLKGSGLIVTVPQSDGQFVMLKEGQTFVVRFFSGKNAFAFTTTVNKQSSAPFPHLYLAYPRAVHGLEIRKASRANVDIIAAVELDHAEGSAAGKIVNLSIGGAALRTRKAIGETGDEIKIKFKVLINDNEYYLAFAAVICSATEQSVDGGVSVLHGIKFIDFDPSMQLALSALVYQKIADGTA